MCMPQILLRESAAAAGASVGYQHGFRMPRAERDARSSWCIVPPEHCVALLDGVVGRLQQWAQGQGPAEADEELLGGSTSSDYTQYRSRLVSCTVTVDCKCITNKKAVGDAFTVVGTGFRGSGVEGGTGAPSPVTGLSKEAGWQAVL